MNIWAWIGLSGIILFSLLPFLKEEKRTKEEVKNASKTVGIVLAVMVAVLVLKVNYLFALFLAFIAFILFNKSTYTKKRLKIYGSIVAIIALFIFVIFRDNPDYVLNHIKENPETTSLYVAENGEEIITYQSDVVRPLASTVKILIAVEYAMQVEEGLLDKNSLVLIDDLNRFYFKNTDGNAHEEWLKGMNEEGKIKNNKVLLHDVAKGMIMYSSNANTDYLMNLLGIEAINERAKLLGLTSHEDVYPIVSALLISNHIKTKTMSESQLIKKLEEMPMEDYRTLAIELSEQMKEGTINIEEMSPNSALEIQKVWSDRLPGASAADYGSLLAIITNDELPNGAAKTMRELLEWPMEYAEGNQKYFSHLGSKGGSTVFILNEAVYAETHDGDKVEIVILIDDVNLWQGLLIGNNFSSFRSKMLGSQYREQVREEFTQ